MKKIIYPLDNGGVGLIHPVADCGLTVEEIARKDVPAGKPYLFIEDNQLPDQVFFEAWEADFSNNNGSGIGPHAWFVEQYDAEIAFINSLTDPTKPEDMTEEEFAFALDQYKTSKAARVAELQKMIATQQAEMAA